MGKIDKVKFWCYKVLPLVYDDSLSYYELLCKVVSKLNELIEKYASFDDMVEEIQTAIDALQKHGFFGNICIVPLEQRHIKDIASLEALCFSEPWSEEGILEAYRLGTKFFIAENSKQLMGYIGIKAVIDEGYITNVTVYPQYRGIGVATALINKVFDFAKEKGLSFVSLEVRASNTVAVSLYEKTGFKEEGRRKNFYRLPREDALIMTKRFSYEDSGN